MSDELLAALCLVMVLEGLFLFVSPAAWKRFARQMQELPDQSLRAYGGVMVVIGLVALQLAR